MREPVIFAPPSVPGRLNADTGRWIADAIWRCSIGNNRILVVLPNDLSDGASIPKPLWRYFGPNPKFNSDYFPAAYCHDFLYMTELISRAEADSILYYHMQALNNPVWLSKAFYTAVHLGGGIVWNRHTPQSIAEARKIATIFRIDPTTNLITEFTHEETTRPVVDPVPLHRLGQLHHLAA